MDSIQVTHLYSKEDLKCVICLEYLNKKSSSALGPHYVCGKCVIMISNHVQFAETI